jgi:probable phosphoglycerate mutase
MLNIYIARHGQDEDNEKGLLNGHRNTPLTLLGIEQAKQLANHVKEIGIVFDKVYSSPLLRSYTTATILTEILKIDPPVKLDILIERNFGIMSGVPLKDIESICSPDILKTDTTLEYSAVTYFLNAEGAETFPQLLERGKEIIDHIQKQHKDGNVLLVCHGDLGKMIYASYYNKDWKEALKKFHFGNSELLHLSKNTSPEEVHVFKTKQFN